MISITVPIIAVTAKKKEWVLSPILIDDSGLQGMTWEDAAKEPWLKGSGTEEDPYMIKNVVIDAGGNFFCMFIMNSEAYFKIMHCTFSNTGPYNSQEGRNAGLILVSTTNGVIIKNEIFGCGIIGSGKGTGIALIASTGNKIQRNFCYDNSATGIYLQYSSNNIISQNLCTGNQWGILISEWSHMNEVTKNECYDNYDQGILVWTESNDNIIYKNNCKRNLNGGITVSGSHGNVISDNLCSENQFGILIAEWSTYNKITNNDCSKNYFGIFLSNVYNNDVFENNIKENALGIYLGGFCQFNIVYHNNIIDNTQQAYDNNLWSNNWNGNFWSDYTSVDLNGDSIGDTDIPWPYQGFGYDYTPFVEQNIWDNSDILYDVLYSENRIRMGSTVYNTDMNYIVLFLGQTIPERRGFLWDPPYTLRILIDGEDIELDAFWWNDKEGELLGEPLFWQVFYHIFEPGSLSTEEHTLEYIYTYYNGAGPYRQQSEPEGTSGFFYVE
jgi:parallel beta-helix repeat protein